MDSLTSVSIRRAGAKDIETLQQLARQDMSRLTDWHHLRADGAYFTYLAEDEAPFGFVSAGEGELIAIYIKSTYRGFGMGRKLFVRGLSVLKRRGFETASIWLGVEKKTALSMIESLGFESDGAERYVNDPTGGTSFELGYRLSLEDYF